MIRKVSTAAYGNLKEVMPNLVTKGTGKGEETVRTGETESTGGTQESQETYSELYPRLDIKGDYAVIAAGGDKAWEASALAGLFENARLIIAADSGASYLRALGIVPHVFVGDFDSCEPKTAEELATAGVSTVTLPRDKDKTDSEAALDIAVNRGCNTIVVLGALGGSRPEHSIANIFLLESYAKKGADVVIYSPPTLICGILGKAGQTARKVILGSPGDWVSLFAVSRKARGVTTEGLRFPLRGAVLKRGTTLGVSNEMLSHRAEISLDQGYLLIVVTKKVQAGSNRL